MPKRDGRDQAELLSLKARSDEIALAKLHGDPEVPDDLIGFHAQQAVEKLLKAVLARHEVEYPRTHDLALLLLLVSDNRIESPPGSDALRALSPWASQFRYDEHPSAAGLNHEDTEALVAAVRQWATSYLAEDDTGHLT